MKPSLAQKLAGTTVPTFKALWQGPCDPGPQGGVTYSLLTRFLTCRERFRVHALEGWRPQESFSHRMEYGNMWHVCEEAHAANEDWHDALQSYAKSLCMQYPFDQPQIVHWHRICEMQFPLYVEHWSKHQDVVDRTPLFQEQVFNVPYTIPSGRIVHLRGRWDAVDLIGKGKDAGIYLMEHKTKGTIEEEQVKRQLTADLQTMLYLTTINLSRKDRTDSMLWDEREFADVPLSGVRYNVIRRPLAGGKGTIRQKNNESEDEFYARLAVYIEEEPEHYFMRWTVNISQMDVQKFQTECLNGILEQLCDWYAAVSKVGNPFETGLHWRQPFGCGGKIDEYDDGLSHYVNCKSTTGLIKATTLFRELEQ